MPHKMSPPFHPQISPPLWSNYGAEILQSLAPAITELRDNQNMLQAAVQQQDQAPRRPSIKPTKPDTFKPNNTDLNLWLLN